MAAFYIPDIKAMVTKARNAFRAEMPGTDANVWPNNIYVSAKVIGGAVWEVFGRLKWMDRQRFVVSADLEGLKRHALDYNMSQKGASYSGGNAVIAATSYPLVVPAETVFTRADGVTFTTTIAGEVGQYSLEVSVPVICNTAGKIGNTVYGTPLTATLAGVASVNVDELGLGGGTDIESTEQLRSRILLRKRYPPRGGAPSDYILWGLSIPGVTRVFPVANAYGRGTVGVWFLMDDTYTAGIPQPVDVLNMQTYLDSVAPITANVIAAAPLADCIDITIKGLKPDTQGVRQSVSAELQSMFRNMAQPGLPNESFTLYQSWIWQAVSNATGERSHTVVAPVSDLQFTSGVMPCLRSVTFIP